MKKGLKITLVVGTVLFFLCAGVCGGGSFLSGWAINGSGDVNVSRIAADWTVKRDYALVQADPLKFKAALEEKCVAMGNGWRILFNHAWYNTMTSDYDLRVWLEASEGYGYYGLYIWGNKVFLRNGFGDENYQNRVLTCEISTTEWEAM